MFSQVVRLHLGRVECNVLETMAFWRAFGCGWVVIAELATQVGLLQLKLLIAIAGEGTEAIQALDKELLNGREGRV